MKKLTTFLFAFLFLQACATVDNSATIYVDNDIYAMRYNSLAQKYYDRRAGEWIKKLTNGQFEYWLVVEGYGSDFSAVTFNSKYAQEYVNLIDKYFEWEALASSSKDTVDKEIGSIKTTKNGENFTTHFGFFSASSQTHFLTLSPCPSSSGCISINLKKNDAAKLQTALIKLAEGTLQQKPPTDRYQ